MARNMNSKKKMWDEKIVVSQFQEIGTEYLVSPILENPTLRITVRMARVVHTNMARYTLKQILFMARDYI